MPRQEHEAAAARYRHLLYLLSRPNRSAEAWEEKLTRAEFGQLKQEKDDLLRLFGPSIVPRSHAPVIFAQLGQELDAEGSRDRRGVLKRLRRGLVSHFGPSVRALAAQEGRGRRHFTLSKPTEHNSIMIVVLGTDGEPIWKRSLQVENLWLRSGGWDRTRVAARLRALADRLDRER